jgi:dihydropyrimidinase
LEVWKEKASIAAMDYCFHMAVTGWNDKVHKDMKRITEEEGINSYKFFMAYKG